MRGSKRGGRRPGTWELRVDADRRLNDDDRAILRRLTSGDLVDEFADALAGDVGDDDLPGWRLLRE
jgi:hypothetical protein